MTILYTLLQGVEVQWSALLDGVGRADPKSKVRRKRMKKQDKLYRVFCNDCTALYSWTISRFLKQVVPEYCQNCHSTNIIYGLPFHFRSNWTKQQEVK